HTHALTHARSHTHALTHTHTRAHTHTHTHTPFHPAPLFHTCYVLTGQNQLPQRATFTTTCTFHLALLHPTECTNMHRWLAGWLAGCVDVPLREIGRASCRERL